MRPAWSCGLLTKAPSTIARSPISSVSPSTSPDVEGRNRSAAGVLEFSLSRRPDHAPRVLAYQLQSDAFGDLDKSIRRNLRSEKDDGSGVPFDRRAPQTRQGVALKAGALLVREWKGRLAPQIAAAPPPPLHLVEARLVAPSVIDPRWASRSRVGDGGGVFEAMGAGSGLSYQLGGSGHSRCAVSALVSRSLTRLDGSRDFQRLPPPNAQVRHGAAGWRWRVKRVASPEASTRRRSFSCAPCSDLLSQPCLPPGIRSLQHSRACLVKRPRAWRQRWSWRLVRRRRETDNSVPAL